MVVIGLVAADMQDDGFVSATIHAAGVDIAQAVRTEPEQEKLAVNRVVAAEPRGATADLWQELRRDPVVLVSVVLLLCGFVYKLLAPSPQPEKGNSAKGRERRAEPRARNGGKNPVQINKAILAQPTADAVLDFAAQSADRADLINVVTALHRAAKLHPAAQAGDPRVQALLAQLAGFLSQELRLELAARAVSTVSRALANMLGSEEPGEALQPVLSSMFDFFCLHTGAFKPEELTRTVYAFTDMRYRKADVLQAAARCAAQWSSWTDSDLVWVAWAFARLVAAVHPRLVQASGATTEVGEALQVLNGLLSSRLQSRVADLPPKLVGMLAWAAVQIHLSLESQPDEVRALLVAIANNCARRVATFQPGEACSILWALSKCHVPHDWLFEACRDRALAEGFRGYKAQDLANMACAYVNMTKDEDQFLTKLARAIEAHKYNEVERRMVHWAYAQRPHLIAPKLVSRS